MDELPISTSFVGNSCVSGGTNEVIDEIPLLGIGSGRFEVLEMEAFLLFVRVLEVEVSALVLLLVDVSGTCEVIGSIIKCKV
jgi:hypothetical protein